MLQNQSLQPPRTSKDIFTLTAAQCLWDEYTNRKECKGQMLQSHHSIYQIRSEEKCEGEKPPADVSDNNTQVPTWCHYPKFTEKSRQKSFLAQKIQQQLSKVSRSLNDSLSALQASYQNHRRKRKFARINSETCIILTDEVVGIPAQDAQDMQCGLKTETASVVHDFMGETTAHGYKRIISPKRSKSLRILWALLIMAVTGIVLINLYNVMRDQQLNTFSSSFRSEPKRRMSFPAVTVCNLFPFDASRTTSNTSDISSEIQKEIFIGTLQIFDGVTPEVTTDWSQYGHLNTKIVDDLVGWRLDSFIIACSWNERPLNCSDIFVRSLSSVNACYTFNSDPMNQLYTDLMGGSSGLKLLVRVGDIQAKIYKGRTAGVKVLLHGPHDFPNTQDQGILVAPNSAAYISVDKKQYKFLPKPYMAYGTEYCADYNSETEVTYKYYNHTGSTWCMAECRLREIIATCGCVAFPGDPAVPGVPYCDLSQYSCYVETRNRVHMWSPYNHTNCSCPLPCNKEEYTGRISTALYTAGRGDAEHQDTDGSSYVTMKIYYEDLFVHVEEHIPKYTWADVFGNVGGQIGLFTGASVLTVLEFVELGWLMTLLGCRGLYMRLTSTTRSRKRSRSTEMDNNDSVC